jgi:HK97 family phage prohead protease
MKTDDLENRFVPAGSLEIRKDGDDKPPTVEGYASVFDSETQIGGAFREVIRKGAFTEAVKRDDVVFLINHDGLPLARTRSGSLELKEDKKGLFMRAELDPNDPDVQRIIPKMERGDLDKMSFGFWIEKEAWTEAEDERKLPLREVMQARLYDVSIVTTPAYESTEIGLRGFQRYKDQNSVPNAVRRARMKMKAGQRAQCKTRG